jgi:hypothetical protein
MHLGIGRATNMCSFSSSNSLARFFAAAAETPFRSSMSKRDEAVNFTKHDITVVYDVLAKVTNGMQVEIRDRAMRPSDRIKK